MPRKRTGAKPPNPPSGDHPRKLAPTTSTEPQDGTPVASIRQHPKVTTGKPKRLQRVASMKLGFSGAGLGTSGTMDASAGNFYSPELSTDFLELPQSRAEQWAYYRFFYKNNPFVGQAIDLHTELPLSRIRLNVPKAKSRDLAAAATRFCEGWAKRVKLLHRLISVVHEYHLIGVAYIFAEDKNPDIPEELLVERIPTIVEDSEGNPVYDEQGNPLVEDVERPRESKDEAVAWMKKNYKGWTAIRCLPPEQVVAETFNFTDEKLIELVPDAKTRRIVQQAEAGDPRAQRIVQSMPADVVRSVREGTNIPLGTDPDAGSFVYCMENKKSDYADKGDSVLARCLLPGVPVTILREGTVLDVPVEQVDDRTDLLLTHTGHFKPARGGSRPVHEEVVVIRCDGDVGVPLALTCEHRVLVVREGGVEDWVEAQYLQEGDVLRESHVVSIESSVERACDIAGWWQERRVGLDRRVRPNHLGEDTPAGRDAQVVDVHVEGETLVVAFEHPQDDANRLHAVAVDRKVHLWLSSLQEPTLLTAASVGALLGLTKSEIDSSTARFRRCLPGFMAESKGRQTLWHPIPKGTSVPGEATVRVEVSPVTRLPMDDEMAYMLGAWFGDGCVWHTKEEFLNARHVMWSCGNAQVRERIQKAASRLGSVQVGHIIPGNGSEVEQVWVEDPLLARWFRDQFGHGAAAKSIPAWVFALPEGQILSFLQGVLDTDGCVSVSRNATNIHVVLDNEQLVRQLHLLCNRIGLCTSVSKNEKAAREWTRTWETKRHGTRTKTYTYDAKTYWNLTCSRSDDVRRWATGAVKGVPVVWPARKYAWASGFTSEGWRTRKIRTIKRVPYTGPVYSFDVEGDESLVASGKVIHNCLQTLVHWDKLRQANASIASRHMTPHRVVWAENMDAADTEALREQVDMSLQDPDFSIISNFQINWEEMGSDQRLLDLTSEMEMTNRELYAGLGVTEGLLTGESSYSGDKISLEVINTRYMLLRELLQDFVEEFLFKPMCRRMGFIEEDEDGNEVVIYPKLSFTRLALRDNQETFDALLNLYQKGSLDIDVILELLNIDPVATREKIERDLFTVNDALFNEVFRGLYGEVGRTLGDPEKSDAVEKVAKAIGVRFNKPKPPGRFDANAE